MIKKIEIVEKIQSALNGGDDVSDGLSRYHPSDIEANVDEVYADILQNMYSQNMRSKMGFDPMLLDDYTRTYNNIPVQYDEVRCEFYSQLPVTTVSLPFNSSVRFISPQQEQKLQFSPVSNNASVVFSELEVDKVDNVPSFYMESNRVYYSFPVHDYKKVLMKLVPSFSSLLDDDLIPEPSIVGQRGLITIYDIVVARFRNMLPEDLMNDNNSKQV